MADNRYRTERGGTGGQRRDSIFSDNDGGRSGGRDHDRGFFERAGEEVRSWFGGDDDRGGRDHGRGYGGSGGGVQSWGQANDAGSHASHYGSEHGRGGFQGDYGGGGGQGGFGGRGDWGGDRGGYRSGGSPGAQGQRPSADQHDHYRSWRDRQIEQFDRDYEDYCRERQQQFHSDFSSWRQSRSGRGSGMVSGTGTGDLAQGSGGTTSGSNATGSGGSSPAGGEAETAGAQSGSRSKA